MPNDRQAKLLCSRLSSRMGSRYIHLLSIVKSNYNHTIPILDEVALGIENVIAMPKERVLANVSDPVFYARSCRGFHSCISKPWLTLASSPTIFSLRQPQARSDYSSFDFSVSVQVPDQESWIEGYRGTEGYGVLRFRILNFRQRSLRRG